MKDKDSAADRSSSPELEGALSAFLTHFPIDSEGKGGLLGPVPRSVEDRLFEEGYRFDFFQAVRILERLNPQKTSVGRGGPPGAEPVRFCNLTSLSFPSSPIAALAPPTQQRPVPTMSVTFLGLTGPSGVMPAHYTELLIRMEREGVRAEKYALRDWFDLFGHRFVALFYWAWKKYRFYIPYEEGEYARSQPDPFTHCLLSLVGLGTPSLRNRLRVVAEPRAGVPERTLARIDDLALLRYAGILGHRPRCAVSLEALLQEYFGIRTRIEQFRGQWLQLEPAHQSRLGITDGNALLGTNAVAGERVWDVESKIRIRLGPLSYQKFEELLPDPAPAPERKTFFLLAHLVRLYVGLELDFDVQLVLRAQEIPACQLAEEADIGPRLGWNTWLCCQPGSEEGPDAEDAVFEGVEY